MVQQQENSACISNVQNPSLNAKEIMQWSEEQQEILRDSFEGQIVNETMLSSLKESLQQHKVMCNCVGCN